jgi:IS30 family transposase
MSGRRVASEEFWTELRAGATVLAASRAVGVSQWTGYRWLTEIGGPAVLGVERRRGRPWGGRFSEPVRDEFWAELRLGSTVAAAARAAGVSKHTGYAWLTEAGGVRPPIVNPELEAAGRLPPGQDR